MGTFRFKQFEVVNDSSPMKVGTDGVLLGAAVTLFPDDSRLCAFDGVRANCQDPFSVLDVGTGTGVIALMLAQRLLSGTSPSASGQPSFTERPSCPEHPSVIPERPSCPERPSYHEQPSCLERPSCQPDRNGGSVSITGIDIDAASAAEAGLNFARSPWAYALEARRCALRDFVPAAPLDLIVSNPPYFEDSLLPPEHRRGLARHAAGSAFSFADLADFAATHLRRPSPIPSASSASPHPAASLSSASASPHPAASLSSVSPFPHPAASLSSVSPFPHPSASPSCHPERIEGPLPVHGGRLAVILPADQETSARRYATSVGLRVFRILRIRTTPRKPVSRVILEFTAAPYSVASSPASTPASSLVSSSSATMPAKPVASTSSASLFCALLSESELTIMDAASYPDNKNGFTPDYLALTGDFYL